MTNTPIVTALPLAPGRWALDPAHSSIGFAVRHLGVAKVRGRFAAFDVDVVIGDSLDSTAVTATVDLASIDTGNTDRDAHTRADDLMDVARRPTMTFRSTSITGSDADWRIDGAITIGEVTRPFSLDVELGGIQELQDGPRRAGFEATGEFRRSDFGIAPSLPSAMLGDVIKVQIDLELLEPAPGA
jgi:polyisoprenoid-binding protein YceI